MAHLSQNLFTSLQVSLFLGIVVPQHNEHCNEHGTQWVCQHPACEDGDREGGDVSSERGRG